MTQPIFRGRYWMASTSRADRANEKERYRFDLPDAIMFLPGHRL